MQTRTLVLFAALGVGVYFLAKGSNPPPAVQPGNQMAPPQVAGGDVFQDILRTIQGLSAATVAVVSGQPKTT